MSMFYRIKCFFKKIGKIFSYLPLLWEDEDWDFDYLITLIEFKLKRMRNEICDGDIIVYQDRRDVRIGINRTLYYIDCYRNISDESKEAFIKEFGVLPFKVGHKFEHYEDGLSRAVTINADTGKSLTDEEDKMYTQHIHNMYNFEQNSWKGIFDTIKEEGQKWWD